MKRFKLNNNKKQFGLRGVKFEQLEQKQMKSLQGSGNTDNNNISEHNFAAKILMKKKA